MGIKGDKLSQDAVSAAESLAGKLDSIGGISTKKMFGGYGIFHEGKMFGIVDSKGQAFLKADDSNRAWFEEKGAHQHARMPYLSIPAEVMSDHEMLTAWAERSIAISK